MPALEIVPTVVHDLAGQTVTLSTQARRELARLIETGAAYIYVPAGPDRDFYNVWLERAIDDATGYRGVRTPLADWARAFDAAARRSAEGYSPESGAAHGD